MNKSQMLPYNKAKQELEIRRQAELFANFIKRTRLRNTIRAILKSFATPG